MLAALALTGCATEPEPVEDPFQVVFDQLATVELGCRGLPDEGQRRFGDVLALSSSCTTVVDDTDVELTVVIDDFDTLQSAANSLTTSTFVITPGALVVVDANPARLAELVGGLIAGELDGQLVAHDDSDRFCELAEEMADLVDDALRVAHDTDSTTADILALEYQVGQLATELEEEAPEAIADIYDSPLESDQAAIRDYIHDQCGVDVNFVEPG
uniref:Uncharacterized protein n=1 Tax=Euzebya pacifica TaxID=1608957 RepID=A0A346Y600_9ACTN|nr:hypothetical protein DVS28_b0127 [Euzebya pacifica]